jgi:peptide/nickel transport system substrate-binding protein
MSPRAVTVLAAALSLSLGGCGKDSSKPSSSGGPASESGSEGGPGQQRLGDEIKSDGPWAQDTYFAPDDVTPGGRVVLALLTDPDSLNPYLSTASEANDIHEQVFPRLTYEHPDFASRPPKFTPYLAESWEFSDDRKKLTFHLRKDAFWSDGVPITAKDVRYSWVTAKNKEVAWANTSIKDHIHEVEVVDDKTVVLHYSEVYPYQEMDATDGPILPEHVFGKIPYADWKTKASWTAEAGVAGGPYRVKEYVDQQHVTLEANPRYFRKGFPRIPTVVYRIIKDRDSVREALMSGGVDVMQQAKAVDVKRLREKKWFWFFNHTSRAYSYLGWNCAKAPLDDPALRRAITHAIDREDIVESVFLGYATVGTSPIISAFWAHDRDLKPWPYDPAEAKRMFDELGWKAGAGGKRAKDGRPLAFTVSVNSANQERKQICEKVQAQLARVGVAMEIELVEPNTLAERLRTHDVQAWYGAWNVATKVDEKTAWHSTSRGRDGYNWANYVNPRVDEIIDSARTMTDFDKATALWHEFEAIIHREQPYTFMSEPRALNFYRKEIRNVKSTASPGPYANLEEWWLEGGKEPAR